MDSAVEAWKSETTAFDRVRSVAGALDRPRTAAYIAEQAAVSDTTAHAHLERLVEMNVLRTVVSERAVQYEPDPLYIRFQAVRELLVDNDHGALVELKATLTQRVTEWQEQYKVSSPAELRQQAATCSDPETLQEMNDTANQWELTQYHLSIVDDAITNYAEYKMADTASVRETTP